MKRRSLILRSLAFLGLVPALPALPATEPAKASQNRGNGARLGPWELIRFVECEHVDHFGFSLVGEIRDTLYGREDRLLVSEVRKFSAEDWRNTDREAIMPWLKQGVQSQLDNLNASEMLALYA